MSDTPPPPPPPPPPSTTPPPPPSPPGSGAGVVSYSSWINRVVATIVRGLVALVFVAPFLVIGRSIGGVGFLLWAAGYGLGIVAAIRLLIQRGHLGYDAGDAAVGQRLIQEQTGAPLGSGGMAFVRSLAHILDSLACYIGYLWPLWDAKNQTFADKVMTTVVVEDPEQPHGAGDLFKNALMFWTPVIKD